MAAKKKAFPKQVFVIWDGDDEPYLDARPESKSFEDGQKVAIYELREVKTQKVTEELV